ncbi:MAG: VOC family protein [Actinomycetota bacterium]|nr:VOC family protein [Actinomycetota bacterium]
MGRVTAAVPVLPSRDLHATVAFYRDELGFDGEVVADDYAVVHRDGVQIHFWGPARELDPMENDGGCRLRVEGVDDFYAQFREHVFAELGDRPWGRDFAVLDPDRNLVWFHE